VSEINASGGKAIGISTDLSDAQSVTSTFDKIKKEFPDLPLAAAVFNSGGGFARKPFLELTEDDYVGALNSQARGGFLFSQATLPLLLKGTSASLENPPTLIFTGATASVRGSAKFASFASGKFALRALSQSLAREFGPQGVHVGHAIVDGVINIPRTKGYGFSEEQMLSPDSVSSIIPGYPARDCRARIANKQLVFALPDCRFLLVPSFPAENNLYLGN
jgi:NAD(P)-dependent dehydrogenase (short-subunit alcohol dehydrogenase family)